MSKSKEHKIVLGKSRPTENSASRSMDDQETDKWVAKIDAASKVEGIDSQINAVAKVLIELAEEIKVGKSEVGVFRAIMRRRNVIASLQIAYNKLRYIPVGIGG